MAPAGRCLALTHGRVPDGATTSPCSRTSTADVSMPDYRPSLSNRCGSLGIRSWERIDNQGDVAQGSLDVTPSAAVLTERVRKLLGKTEAVAGLDRCSGRADSRVLPGSGVMRTGFWRPLPVAQDAAAP